MVTRYKHKGNNIVQVNAMAGTIKVPNKTVSTGKTERKVKKSDKKTIVGKVDIEAVNKEGEVVWTKTDNLVLENTRIKYAMMVTGEILSGWKIVQLYVGDQGHNPINKQVPNIVDPQDVALRHKTAEYDKLEHERTDSTATFVFKIPFEDLNGTDLSEWLLVAEMNDTKEKFPFSITNTGAIAKHQGIALNVYWKLLF